MGARRQAEVDPLEHAAVSARRGETRRADRRGHRRRRAHPADAHSPIPTACGRRIRSEPRLMIRRDPIGNRRHVLPHRARRHGRGLRRLHAAHEEGPCRDSTSIAIFRRPGARSSSSSAPARIPTSEPEVRAVVDFVVAPSATSPAASSFHTWSGVLLRPFEHQPDEEMHAEDLWVYQAAGKKGTELTGYPHISVYHEFRYHPKSVIGGTFDWVYEHLGMFSWVVEIWSPMREAGIADYKYIDWFRDHPPEDDLKLLRWSDSASSAASRTFRGSRSTIRSSARSRSAAGIASTRSPIRRRSSSSASSRAFRSGSSGRRSISPKLELVHAAAKAEAPAATTAVAARRAEHGLAAVVRRRSARWSARSCAALIAEIELPAGATLVAGQAPRGARPARRPRVQAHRHLVLAGLPRHRRSHEDRMGRAREARRRGEGDRAARARRHRARRRDLALTVYQRRVMR